MLEMFCENSVFEIRKEGEIIFQLVPSRLRGDLATFDIKDKKGKVLIEEGQRMTARHIRQLEKAGIDQMELPKQYLLGRALAKDVDDENTGALLLEGNAASTQAVLATGTEAGP